jgi:hypothetical protein
MEVWWIGPDGSVRAAWHESEWNRYALAGSGAAATTGGITAVFKGNDSMEVWWVAPDGSVTGGLSRGRLADVHALGSRQRVPDLSNQLGLRRVAGCRRDAGVVGRPGRCVVSGVLRQGVVGRADRRGHQPVGRSGKSPLQSGHGHRVLDPRGWVARRHVPAGDHAVGTRVRRSRLARHGLVDLACGWLHPVARRR